MQPAVQNAGLDDADFIEASQLDGLIEAAGVEGVREILGAFWRSTEGLLVELRGQLQRCDRAGASRVAHALKGSALNVGAVRLAETVRKVEDACKADDFVRASLHVSAAEADYRATILAFE
ncbi:MAG: Hpt domain-containing protein, partial [Parvularculaceae bacterium]|nr:Hpt domain-containing protein [Parvularculaceae bacterium]